MATFSAVTGQHILAAIAECDERGSENFLGVYGFEPSAGRWLAHEGGCVTCHSCGYSKCG